MSNVNKKESVNLSPALESDFVEWFKDSKITDDTARPAVMYHGTTSDFRGFRENSRGLHFVSPSHQWVSEYLMGEHRVMPEGAQIMPVHVSAKNPFDYENKKQVSQLASRSSLGALAISQIKKGDWQRLEDRTLIDAIKKLGFDGMYVKENGVKNLAVFRANQIRSVFDKPLAVLSKEHLIKDNVANVNSSSIVKHSRAKKALDFIEGKVNEALDVHSKANVTLNSRGGRVAQNRTGELGFANFFNGSKVVSNSGAPVPVFHGTNKDIKKFKSKSGRFYFTDSPEVASGYAGVDSGANIVQAYLSIRNPLVVDGGGQHWAEIAFEGQNVSLDAISSIAKKRGYDGVIANGIQDLASMDVPDGVNLATSYVVFDPSQIKSAIGNPGSYCPDSASIVDDHGPKIGLKIRTRLVESGQSPVEKNGAVIRRTRP